MINKIIRSLYYILFFAIPLLVFSKTSELFEFNKIIFIYFITLCITCLWMADKILKNEPILIKKIIFLPFFIFLLSQILSTAFSIDINTSIFGYYGRFNGGLISIISYLLLFYIFIDHFNINHLPKLLKLSLISSTLVVLWGLPGKVGLDLSCLVFNGSWDNSCWADQFRPAERMFSTLGQPNWLGAYLAINFFIGLFFFYRNNTYYEHANCHLERSERSRPKAVRIITFFYLLLNFMAILFTRSDSAILATGVGFLLFSLLMILLQRSLFLSKKTVLLVLAFVTLLFIFKTGNQTMDKFLSFPSLSNKITEQKIATPKLNLSINRVTDSFDIRKIVWKGAIEIGKNYPLFGTGVETFAYSYYFKRPAEHNLTSEWDYVYNKAHNEFLNYFATTGIVGLISYLFMILLVLYMFIRSLFFEQSLEESSNNSSRLAGARSNHNVEIKISNDQLLVTSLLCAYVTILITNFFGFSISVVNLFFYLIPALIIVMLKINKKTQDNNLDLKKSILQKVKLALTIVFFLFGTNFLLSYYIADIFFAKADGYYKAGDYQTASSYLTKALQLHKEHVYEDKLSYSLANLSYLVYYQQEMDTAKNLKTLADYYNLKSLEASPLNNGYWKTRAKNFYLFYQSSLSSSDLKSGVEALNKARSIAPSDAKIPYSLALYYSMLEDEAKDEKQKSTFNKQAFSAIDSSIKLKTNYEDAYFLKGQLLKRSGNKNEAIKIFNLILDNINPENEEAKKELEKL